MRKYYIKQSKSPILRIGNFRLTNSHGFDVHFNEQFHFIHPDDTMYYYTCVHLCLVTVLWAFPSVFWHTFCDAKAKIQQPFHPASNVIWDWEHSSGIFTPRSALLRAVAQWRRWWYVIRWNVCIVLITTQQQPTMAAAIYSVQSSAGKFWFEKERLVAFYWFDFQWIVSCLK